MSRDQVKEFRQTVNEESAINSEPVQENKQEAEAGFPRRFKFKFASEDKSLKLDFNIKAGDMNRDKLVNLLENLVNDIREGRIADLPF
jgi:hypothetical protein